MTENLEIEFKNMLTKQEYEKLLHTFRVDEKQIFTQENHYFDTPEFALKNLESALRIRRKKDHFEMTLKQPASIGLLETNQLINEDEAAEAIHFGRLPSGKIKNILEEKGISFTAIQYFGSLVTKRVEMKYEIGLLVLDHSLYLNKEDYELEYEVKDYQTGKDAFIKLLQDNRIPERKTMNKIRRFYQEKYVQSSSN
ncbi:CYTH domain-containing protein [Neobacillus mesonae]|uniref:CYTH domain-containing protein n=1 Tax=Neobacillus mesonae TaxID=1193713 RepID=A0A3Q9QXW2_9BACI|nr:CYTH domain-containing protein [Neobacillus mesonae]AZU61274.1 CYTH domain-containing protein [Neobacillus mesonae]